MSTTIQEAVSETQVRRFGHSLSSNIPPATAAHKNVKSAQLPLVKPATAPDESSVVKKKAKSQHKPKRTPNPTKQPEPTEKKLAFALSPPRHAVEKIIESLVTPNQVQTQVQLPPPLGVFDRKAVLHVYTREYLLQWEHYRTGDSPIAAQEIKLILRMDETPVTHPKRGNMDRPPRSTKPDLPFDKTKEKADKLISKAKGTQPGEEAKARARPQKLQQSVATPTTAVTTNPIPDLATNPVATPSVTETVPTSQCNNSSESTAAQATNAASSTTTTNKTNAPASTENSTANNPSREAAKPSVVENAPSAQPRETCSAPVESKVTRASSKNKENEQPATNTDVDKAGKDKKKETNDKRLAQRQKQIDFGKNTEGYRRYRELIPKNKRKRGHLRTPDRHQICSKRSWDGQIRKWRRFLHLYDNLVETNENRLPTQDDLKDDELLDGEEPERDDKSNDEQDDVSDNSDNGTKDPLLAEQKTSAVEISE